MNSLYKIYKVPEELDFVELGLREEIAYFFLVSSISGSIVNDNDFFVNVVRGVVNQSTDRQLEMTHTLLAEVGADDGHRLFHLEHPACQRMLMRSLLS